MYYGFINNCRRKSENLGSLPAFLFSFINGQQTLVFKRKVTVLPRPLPTPCMAVRVSCRGLTSFTHAQVSDTSQLCLFSSPFQRGLCCFPGFTNPVTAQRKGKIPKPLLAGVSGGGGGSGGGGSVFDSLLPQSGGRSEMLLLEKQGRASQQHRMQEAAGGAGSAASEENSKTLPPSSLPRPPRPAHRSGLPRYNRLPESETPRKKSDGGESLSSNASSRRASPARSLIPPPRKLGEYGRLSESGGSTSSLRKPSMRVRAGSGERDSASTLSDNSASSLPTPSKVRLFGGSTRRGSSLGRDSKSSTDSTANKYRIQF